MRTLTLFMMIAGLMAGCTSIPVVTVPQTAKSPCANLDWYELGRADGHQGAAPSKLEEHRRQCGASVAVDADAYANGREAGLVDFCSPSGAFEAGRNGVPDQGVCPEYTRASFQTHYALGRKVRELESENSDLESRIEDLSRLVAPLHAASSVQAQIENLKSRRAQNDAVIDSLETKAGEN